MSEIKIANRYAQALMQQAITDNNLSAVASDMQSLYDTCMSSKDLRNVLSNPIIASGQKLAALKTIFKNFDVLTSNLLQLVCSRNRENILPGIAEAFLSAYR